MNPALEGVVKPFILMLSFCCVTATLLISFGPAPSSGFRRWRERVAAWFARLPIFRKGAWNRRTAPGYAAAQGPAVQLQGRLALGLYLASYFETHASLDQTLLNQITWLRRELYLDTGMVMPSITVVQERSLQPFEYSLTFGSKELARGSILPAHWLVSVEGRPDWVGERELSRHPITGTSTLWITANELPQALAHRARCEDGLEVFAHHLRHAVWQNTTSFVTVEFCQQYLNQGLERSSQVRAIRRVLESNQGRLASLMQLVLAMGGSLRDPARVLFLAGNGMLRGDSIEAIARRVVDSSPRGPQREAQQPPTAVSSALLYSYFWNEHLSGDLMSRSDPQSLENLALGMLEVQNLPPAVLEQMWFDTLSGSEMFLLGRSAELADQLHQMLQYQQGRPSRLGKSEQAAILLLSLPRDLGQLMATSLFKELTRNKVEEVVQAMGRFGYLLLQAPPGQGMRQLTELGFRERIISDFLDFVNYSSLNQPQPPGAWLSSWLKEQRQFPVDDLAYAVEKYYFPSLEPVTRLRRAVEQDPLRISRGLVAYALGDSSPLSATSRAPLALQSLHPEVGNGIMGRLRGRGCNLPCSIHGGAKERGLCEWEFFLRVAQPYSNPRWSLR
ncbi:MAG: FHIPEP family type III secretion protein [Candidatus Eremiobacteraeota bacterium]|nr:FHIPEP family type III secretion protein [Candidatus Eremiobacteraeota bacterium]